jgi:hypothetical protein
MFGAVLYQLCYRDGWRIRASRATLTVIGGCASFVHQVCYKDIRQRAAGQCTIVFGRRGCETCAIPHFGVTTRCSASGHCAQYVFTRSWISQYCAAW